MFRSYLIKFAALLLLPMLLVGMNIVFLRRTGELSDFTQVLLSQRENAGFCLYGSALSNDTLHYKIEGYALAKPKIAVIGSSRGLEFRKNFFTESFYNMGGTMPSVDQGVFVVDRMLNAHVPDVLLIAVDFWWFNDMREDPFYQREVSHDALHAVKNAFEPFRWIRDGKVSFGEYVSMILHGHEEGDCSMGVSAWKKKGGFAADGSYYFAAQIAPVPAECSTELIDGDLATIDTEDMWFIPLEARFSEERLDAFLSMVGTVRSRGTEVILVLPPFPRNVYAAMESHGQEALLTARLERAFRQHDIPFLNAHDPKIVDSPDCEFVDSIHGGNVTYARMVRRIAGLSKKTFVDTSALDRYIQEYAGGVTGAMLSK